MNSKFITNLITAAVEKELYLLIKNKKIDPSELAKDHAIKMIEEIISVANERISNDNKMEKIVKILAFCPVPPHVD